MRALVIYESIFGNTRQIAEAIGEGLRGGCDEVEVVEVGQAEARRGDVDLLVVGGPTHAWSMSRAGTRRGAAEQARRAHREPVSAGVGVREWLQSLKPRPDERMAAAFDTALRQTGPFPFGSAARSAAHRLEDLRYRLLAEPEQFFVKATDGPLEAGELERARAWGVHLSARAKERAFVPLRPARRTSESVGAIVGNLLGVTLTLLHELWRPLTLGVVTASWAAVVAPVSLACLVTIVGHALLLAFPTRLLRRVVDCVLGAANLVSAAAVYRVFPFDFAALGMPWFDPILQLILLIVMLVTAVALAVRVVLLLVRLARG